MAVATASPPAVGDAAASSSSGKAAAAGAAPPPAQQQPHTTTSVGDNNTSTSSRTTSTATTTTSAAAAAAAAAKGVTYRQYVDEHDLPAVMALVDKDLSEPYSVFTYRYFLAQWPQLCFLAHDGGRDGPPIGVVVCKVEPHRGRQLRGYLAMLVVDKAARGRGVGSALARMAIQAMADAGAEEVALEAEVTNLGALALYRALGFLRDKRLHRYYLSGNDAYRLKLQLPLTPEAHARKKREREALLGFADDGTPLDAIADAAAGVEEGGEGQQQLSPLDMLPDGPKYG